MMVARYAGGKIRRTRIPLEDVDRGAGIMVEEAPDFPRAERDRLAEEVLAAYKANTLPADQLTTYHCLHIALTAPAPMQEAIRFCLGVDGREAVTHLHQMAATVPVLTALADWIM